ncbi:hypothetical protein Fbal_3525 [Ferrimonas balearica DSM 9799]|uniref:Uncharacterized protein n=1 Tax=Ferrimonas balearica (strain DSM 9799 / CCM 4581 / KCTC 23876 / PAT) TaxID=550540 RepID=E1SNR5_FERBD|nr:hypothetical protein [Ferrimonas balearica]MBY6019181.1 hypothetical protein [Halomonas denitrificans]ADN77722.1 hypothetical protein Fbal_3525 [Ferrimonas balearica DSM 9799]MBW3140911.1 hypothetical protein [Ferrimonas balearica]MBY5981796.1 hypothetical protein [Ferrimonas balearica]MBY6095784.1 hypothetical protein [Ferrimonas balearica]
MQVQVGIDIEKLAALVRSGAVCIADLQALDADTKAALWRLCLHCVECDRELTQSVVVTPYTDRR